MIFQSYHSSVCCWFSCGAASAVATAIALKESPLPTVVRNIYVDEEHESNDQFLLEVQSWLQVEILRHKDDKYGGSIYEVFRREQFIKSPFGAACTKRLKRIFYKKFNTRDTVVVTGLTIEEMDRFERMQESDRELDFWCPLIEHKLTKRDCLALISRAGIDLPIMYRLGYNNNNCLGCVKGGMGYWNKIRDDFPTVFDKMVQMQQDLGEGSFFWKAEEGWDGSLKCLPRDKGHYPTERSISCGVICELTDSIINESE